MTPMSRLQHSKPKLRLFIFLLAGIIFSNSMMLLLPVYGSDALSDSARLQRIMAMYANYRKAFAGIQEIDASAAIELVGDPEVVFVDVRDPEEQAVSMIPGAVTSEVFLAAPERYQSQRIIGYCTISYRSGKLAARMGRKGITIVNLKGGLLAWVHNGGTLVRGYKPVKQMHVYGRQWDLAPSDIETVY
jgi:sodium/bile acid cotransporter 7